MDFGEHTHFQKGFKSFCCGACNRTPLPTSALPNTFPALLCLQALHMISTYNYLYISHIALILFPHVFT